MDILQGLVQWFIANCPSEKQADQWKVADLARMQQECEDGDRILVAGAQGLKKNLRLAIPPKCVLRMDTVVQVSVVGKIFESLDRYTLFAMFLIMEDRLGEASFWKPYLDSLPRNIKFHPITFMTRIENDKVLADELAKEPLLLRALQSQHEKLRQEFDNVLKLLTVHLPREEVLRKAFGEKENFSPPTYDEFLWANCMVISRAFDMHDPKVMCMLPFADLMNHSTENATIQWRPRLPKNYFVIHVLRDLQPGEELTANYHGVQNKQTHLDQVKQYVMYGFVETSSFDHIMKCI